ncbi:hypothetical protein DPMN_040848 [Dreissena polymorpha]|uniref:Uncharacterized protein n=1 Tax=Dreissena polymorpha TaxID=45954 RepID=A0A9D4HVP2_DREPO|nr:hypothetical protein DPMN_040848 [Dreissena polymorpha]
MAVALHCRQIAILNRKKRDDSERNSARVQRMNRQRLKGRRVPDVFQRIEKSKGFLPQCTPCGSERNSYNCIEQNATQTSFYRYI